MTADPPTREAADRFTYNPTVPVPSLGGGICCIGGAVDAGAFDQRSVEARADVLVYTSEPLSENLEVTGTVEVILYVSSDARDTDFTAKLFDVLGEAEQLPPMIAAWGPNVIFGLAGVFRMLSIRT